MQHDPEKTVGNYNEYYGGRPESSLHDNYFQISHSEGLRASECEEIVDTGLGLVNSRINELLGSDNKLTNHDLPYPEVRFLATCSEYPNWAGYFSTSENKIGIIADKTTGRLGQIKVFIHEYIHFLSHNGCDLTEPLSEDSPIAQRNNIGFRRFFGLDIREGKEGQITPDYFLAFNEAATEELASDILPLVQETYGDYRGLFNQVMDDAVTRGLGSRNETGAFQAWTKEQFKNYVYVSFFKGDLASFTGLLKSVYKEYDISEQQFGLMTHRDDLPSVIASAITEPGSPPPSPTHVAALVQERLNSKTRDDYVTDVIGPDPDDGDDNRVRYGNEYDTHVQKHEIAYSHRENSDGRAYDLDTRGYIIYHGENAKVLFDDITATLDRLLAQRINPADISKHMDALLFEKYYISMLSDGFRDFYIYKHAKLDNI